MHEEEEIIRKLFNQSIDPEILSYAWDIFWESGSVVARYISDTHQVHTIRYTAAYVEEEGVERVMIRVDTKAYTACQLCSPEDPGPAASFYANIFTMMQQRRVYSKAQFDGSLKTLDLTFKGWEMYGWD